jgi:Tol biopolymer transport system component
MKRCPECRRDYTDETLNYCLDDGTALLEGPGTAEQPTAILSGDDDLEDRLTRQFAQATGEPAVPRMSNDAYPTHPGTQNRAITLVVAAGIVALIAGIGFVIYRYGTPDNNTPRSIKLEKITTEGKTFNAAISPDGKYAVYNVDEGGQQSLWTKQLATSSSVQIIPPAEGVEYSGIRFSPDGHFVTFIKRDLSTTLFTLYQMPALGGTQKKLIEDVDGAISYSPDGKQFSFIRGNYPEMGDSVLAIANADGSGERVLAKRRRPETFVWWPAPSAVWSPDGKTIAAVIGGNATGGVLMQIVEVSVEDGSMKPISNKGWYEIKQVAWLPDKSGLLVMGAEKASDYYTQQIYLMSYPSGDWRRITADFNNYIGMSLTADGKSLATVQSTRISNIWIAPNADAGRAVQIKAGGTNQEGTDGLSWAPDGRIVYYSKARGNDDIWIMNGDGSDAKQLTVDAGTNYDLKVTPDGRYVVFTSERAGAPNIWRMDMDGGNPKQLTFGTSEYGVSVTPDSKWLLYDSTASGTPAIWKVSIDGGEPSQVTTRFTENSEVSPDGKFIVCQFRENAVASWRFAIFNIDGGDPIKVFDLPTGEEDIRWGPDGRSVTYSRTSKGVANVWGHPIDGGPDKQLTNFKNDQLFNFKWSPDGKSLVMARGNVMADIVLIHDFR